MEVDETYDSVKNQAGQNEPIAHPALPLVPPTPNKPNKTVTGLIRRPSSISGASRRVRSHNRSRRESTQPVPHDTASHRRPTRDRNY
jgi:hypothetical protein